ncbi:MAG: chromate efflux transporter [Planctomycetaceae bacterium]
MPETIPTSVEATRRHVSYREALIVWCRVAALSFGGPAGQIAVMHRILVEEKKWIREDRFLHALNYCMLLPGPEAQQLATYIGWLMHGGRGGLTAGILFVLPGFVSILILSILYASYQDLAVVQAVFFGLKPAVMAVVVEALIRIGKRVLKNRAMFAIAAAAFVALFFFNVPFPMVVIAAGLIGFLGGRLRPDLFVVVKGKTGDAHGEVFADAIDTTRLQLRPTWSRSAAVLLLGITLWFGPVIAVATTLGPEHVLTQEGMFFSKAAMVTFGGAYSVLTYVAQQAVERFGWLEAHEMLDGLGMAETTPGPLIQVVQFVGFLGAFRSPDPFEPMAAGVLGSLITTWVTYVPCFLWIFLGAPYVERLRERPSLTGALSAITAAVVGVILNLSIWFALRVLFGTVNELDWLGMRISLPDVSTLRPGSLLIAVVSAMMLFAFHRGMLTTLATAAILGVIWHWAAR